MKCGICGREGESNFFEKHHLVPQNKDSDFIEVCHQCADQVHLIFDNKTLAKELNDIYKLKKDPRMKKYISWIKNKPIESHFATATKKRKKR